MDDFTALKSKIKNIALLPVEKAAILEQVAGFVEARPFTASRVGLGYFLGWRFTVPAFLVLFVAVSTITTWAAEGALPGDVLYSVKIKINEEVRGLLAFNPIAKVELEARRVATRLAEAEQLATKGKLNEATGREVTARLEQHASKVKTMVAELKLSGAGEEKAAVEAVARMDNLLGAQQAALTKAAEQDQTVAATVTDLVAKAENIKTDLEQATAGALTGAPDTRLVDLQSATDLVLAQRTYPEGSNFSFYAIHDFKQKNLTPGTYNTEGYVVKIYVCLPCPKDALCKLCMKDNIVISENNKVLDTYSLTNTEMIVFADKPKQFEIGKKYKFSVKLLEYKSTGESINDIELVGYSSIE